MRRPRGIPSVHSCIWRKDRGRAPPIGGYPSSGHSSTNPVELAVDDVGRHGRDLEAAVYFCCVEALQNASKHAGPSAVVRVGLRMTDLGEIEFTIADDGRGFDPATPERGNGFTNMRDRLGAFGGAIEIAASPGAGTRVTGRVPTADSHDVGRVSASAG